MSLHPSPAPAKAIVFWVIWFAILSGLFVIQLFVGGGIPEGPDQGQAPLVFIAAGSVAAFASLLVRFLILPSKKSLEQKLPLMIISLALAEAPGIAAAVVVPHGFAQTRLWMFLAAVGCVIISAPVYAKEEPRNGGYMQ
ncbi:MAG: hypothetical protein QM755_13755 [Luteolibacter sp.]